MSALAKRLLPRARRYLGFRLLRVLEREVGCARPAVCALECRELCEQEVLEFAADPALELDRGWVRDAFARGTVCLGALADGGLVGYTWLAYADTPYTAGAWIGLSKSLRYSHKSFVRPERRGQRIIQALHALADRPQFARGRRASLNFVEADNFASLAALQRTGSRPLGYIAYARLFGVLLAYRSAGVRQAGIRFYAPRARRIADRMRAWLDQSPRSSA